jgi:hypothetical protein
VLLHDDLHGDLLIDIFKTLLEVFNQLSDLVNEIFLASAECLLHILNPVNFFLICLQKAMVTFLEVCQG